MSHDRDIPGHICAVWRHFFHLRKNLNEGRHLLHSSVIARVTDGLAGGFQSTTRTGPIVALVTRVPLDSCSSQSGGTLKIYPFFPHVKSSFLPQPRRTLQKPHSKPSLPGTAFFMRVVVPLHRVGNSANERSPTTHGVSH